VIGLIQEREPSAQNHSSIGNVNDNFNLTISMLMFCGEQEPEKLKKHENALGKNFKNNLNNKKYSHY